MDGVWIEPFIERYIVETGVLLGVKVVWRFVEVKMSVCKVIEVCTSTSPLPVTGSIAHATGVTKSTLETPKRTGTLSGVLGVRCVIVQLVELRFHQP